MVAGKVSAPYTKHTLVCRTVQRVRSTHGTRTDVRTRRENAPEHANFFTASGPRPTRAGRVAAVSDLCSPIRGAANTWAVHPSRMKQAAA